MSAPASKLKLRSGEMVLLREPVEEVLSQLRAGVPFLELVRADGFGNPLYVLSTAIEYVEDVAPREP